MKNNFNKYKYLGNVIPEIPKTWDHIIFNMLKEIDKIIRPRYFPLFLMEFTNSRETIIISKIKQKFGTLRISYVCKNDKIKEKILEAEKHCNDTCEFCGNPYTELVTVKNWVRNLCPECIDKHKK